MTSFDTLYTQAQAINTGAQPYPQDQVLRVLAETKGTCESYDNFVFERSASDHFDLRVCRDLCVAGLNSAENKVSLDARFNSVKALLYTYAVAV